MWSMMCVAIKHKHENLLHVLVSEGSLSCLAFWGQGISLSVNMNMYFWLICISVQFLPAAILFLLHICFLCAHFCLNYWTLKSLTEASLNSSIEQMGSTEF